ncbi:23S rRNA (guanosine(2251)-2'-O)-methyltransferase RlmB [Parenemella sanctibonifatiensis]|uniref:23S rRNA (Guanosine(2251)-2'-O)-methyltransferase RlmB n=1 Tax=Parenemella sanctibonifatiensis TaxID=2016505 RepID=A0A255ELS3_9ACTN|nr:23S rRNA (guanosine(2251)-2'-O)-methyltransferase RlmB [Parenemella sanctibonifatiensis]OYN92498.1 23S rRNA (guanosine(2251)-2'-O)-methyltransferase RlmB [Parenemella sanctibonifatiensis]
MRGNSQRKGAVRKRGKGTGNTTGSGGRIRKSLEGKGPTPKAEDRPYHKAHAAKVARDKRAQATPKRDTQRSRSEWVVGRNPVLEAMEAGIPVRNGYVAEGAERDDRLRDIFKIAADRSMSLLQVTRNELDRLTGGLVHQGVALQLPPFSYAHPDDLLDEAITSDSPLVLVLDHLNDPHNLGAIIRSARAFGANGVIIPERRAAQVTATVWKTSAGAAARTTVARATNLNRTLQAYAKAGFTIVGLAGESDTEIAAAPGLDGPVVLVVGSEGDGLSRLVRENCDVLARISIDGIESLNASVATGIALYEISQHR